MATVISSRPVLTPLSPRKRMVFANVTNTASATQNRKGPSFSKKPLGLSLSTTINKRPFYTIYDENSATQTKRTKPQPSPSCDENTIPKYALASKPVSPVPSGLVVSKKKPAVRRHHLSSSSSSSTSPVGPSSAPSVGHSSAISRKDSLTSLSVSPSHGIKRKIHRRVDPPVNLSKSGNKVESIDARLIATPAANTWRPGQPFPFDIHEDTLEETLTNLMYHGACTLDISDEEDLKKRMTEAERVGKENIPPPPTSDQVAMPPPRPPTPESAGMEAERTRIPLGEADVEIFYPNLRKDREEAEMLNKMEREEKAKALMRSKFAVVRESEPSDVAAAAAKAPLPADRADGEERLAEEARVASGAGVPTISVENCDFDNEIDSQTRSLAEDELFDDDL